MDRVTATMLLDYYGGLLTDKQQLFCDYYYNQDLSLSEIAELEGISRQAVHDAVSKAEALLRNYESKTGYLARELALRRAMDTIRSAAEDLQKIGGPAQPYADTILNALGSVLTDT